MSHPRRSSPTVTFLVLAMGAFTFSLLMTMMTPALPLIQRSLGVDTSTIAWTLTAYLLSASVATPILGRLGDIHGKRRMLLVVLAALLIGAVIAALAPNVYILILGRVVQGIGGAIFPLSFGIMRDEFPKQRLMPALGAFSGLLGIGGAVALVLSGPITETLGWRWLFWLPAIMVSATLITAALLIPESPVRSPGTVRISGALVLSGWLVTLLLAISQGDSWGWTSPTTLGMVIAALLLFLLWIRIESRSDSPLVDLQMMRNPQVARANIIAACVGFAVYSSFLLLAQFVQAPSRLGYGFDASVAQTGLFTLPFATAMLVAGILAGRLQSLMGSRNLLAVGTAVGAVGCISLAALHGAPVDIYVGTAMLGLGLGLAFGVLINVVVQAVDPTQTGAATGMNMNIRTIGGSIGTAVTVTIVTAGVTADGFAAERGYTLAFAAMALATVVAAVTSLTLPADSPRRLRLGVGRPVGRAAPLKRVGASAP